jgi:hypothetical protein
MGSICPLFANGLLKRGHGVFGVHASEATPLGLPVASLLMLDETTSEQIRREDRNTR